MAAGFDVGSFCKRIGSTKMGMEVESGMFRPMSFKRNPWASDAFGSVMVEDLMAFVGAVAGVSSTSMMVAFAELLGRIS